MRSRVKIFDQNRNIDKETNSILEMEELATQLSVIVEQLKKLNDAQVEQDGKLNFLFDKIDKPQDQRETPVKVREQMSTIDLFRIPDPIKSIPHYDGNRKQLSAWLKTAEDTLLVFQPLVSEQQFTLYIQSVLNKIEGKAKDIICLAGNPQSFLEIKNILLEALGDRQELSFYKSQLWSTKMTENMTVHSYFTKIKENVQNIKSLSRQNTIYRDSWPAINAFISEDALAAFISGLRKPYFGYAQAAKPKCIEEAYAFLCKFNSNELISNNSKKPNNPNNSQKPKAIDYYQQKNKDPLPPNYNNKKQTYSVRGSVSPMDVDQSMRTRNSFKKMIHNHETKNEIPDDLASDSNEENSDEIQDGDSGNFLGTIESDTED